MAAPAVIADANVLYAAPLRDLLMELALAGLIRLHWSRRIEEEWTRALIANRPDLGADHIARTATLMNAVIPDAMVEVAGDALEAIHLPDPDDRHVVAAALAADAAVILTFNTSDFPEQDYDGKAVSAVHPDVFLSSLAAVFPERFVAAAARIRARLKAPPVSVSQYLTGLAKLGLPNLAVVLSRHEDAL
jgi:predicted nucleic acid-binding protein